MSKYLITLLTLILASPMACAAGGSFPKSPDGQYEAIPINNEQGRHYEIKETKTGKSLFITRAKYGTLNDVKAGFFSPDSRAFAAAYHYGHEGPATWVGIWQLPSGQPLEPKEKSGYLKDLSWVFSD